MTVFEPLQEFMSWILIPGIPLLLVISALGVVAAIELAIHFHLKAKKKSEEEFEQLLQELARLQQETQKLLDEKPADALGEHAVPFHIMDSDDFEEWMEAVESGRIN